MDRRIVAQHIDATKIRGSQKTIGIAGEFAGLDVFSITYSRTAGTVKQWKTVVSSTNGSQLDHGSRLTDRLRSVTAGGQNIGRKQLRTRFGEIVGSTLSSFPGNVSLELDSREPINAHLIQVEF